jgi:hypothetical protein
MSTLTDLSPLQHLASLELAEKRRKYPNVPESYLVKPTFLVKDANSLTKTVMRCLELHDCYVVRVQSQGQYNARSGQWQQGHTRKESPDLHAVISGQHISIEIKWGEDRLASDQKGTAVLVTRAGGIYLFVSNYDSFFAWFEGFAPDFVEQKRGEVSV